MDSGNNELASRWVKFTQRLASHPALTEHCWRALRNQSYQPNRACHDLDHLTIDDFITVLDNAGTPNIATDDFPFVNNVPPVWVSELGLHTPH